MSGGSFNYAWVRVETFVEELEAKLRRASAPHTSDDGGEWVPELSPEVLAKLAEIAKMGEQFAKVMRQTELLYSGDNGEESFLENLAELRASTGE